MANQIDFIVRNGLQVTTNAVVGTYAMTNSAPLNGMIVSGNVGIGTAAPTSQLEVRGNIQITNTATSISGIRFSDGTYQHTSAASFSTPPGGQTDSIQYNAGGMPATFGGSASFVFHPGNVHVGIGTNRSDYTLHVIGNDQALFSTLNGANYQIGIGTATGNAVVGYNAAGQYAYIGTGNNPARANLVVTSTGLVGIGTSLPGNSLDVRGAVAVGTYVGTTAPTNGLIVSGNVGIGVSNPTAKLDITAGSAQTGMFLRGDVNPGQFLQFVDSNGASKFAVSATGTVTAGGWNGNVITIGYGGTGITTYANGDIVYATTDPNQLAKLSIGAAGNVLVSNGSNPTWGRLNLSSESAVTGTLPIVRGGTNATSFTSNAIVISNNGATALTSLTGATNAAVVFTNAGVPSTVSGGPFTYLTTGAGGGNLQFSNIDLVNGVGGTVLRVANGGTGLSSLAQWSLAFGSGNTSVLSTLATQNTSALVTSSTGAPQWTSGGVSNRVLRTNGTTITFAQVDLTTDVTGVLPYANGGTNASTSFTQGSVIFAGATGFAQDNTNFFFDDSNNRLGIGTTAPTTTLDVNGAATIRNGANVVAGGLFVQSGPGNFAGPLFAANVTSNGFVSGTSLYSSGPISAVGDITGANIRGNTWVRSASFYGTGTINTDGAATFGSITSNAGITGTSILSSGDISAAGAITGNRLLSNTTINAGGTVFAGALISNSTITGGAIQSNSSVTARTMVANLTVAINGTNASTNTTTGALVVSGGVGIGGNLHVGGATHLVGNVLISGNLNIQGNLTTINTDQLSIEDPLIQIGTGPNGAPLTTDDGLDRGMIMHYYTTGTGDGHSYLGRADDTGRLLFVTNVQPGATNIANPILANSPGFDWGTAQFGNLILSAGANSISTSSSTGALIIQGTGGAGIGGGLHVGEHAYVALGFNTGGTATVNRLVSNTTVSAQGQITGGNIVSNSGVFTNTLTANASAFIGGGLNVNGTITAGGLVLNNAVTFSNISASGTISGNILVGNIGIYSGGNINAVNTVFGGALVSNSFINGTSINSSGPISAAGAGTFATLTSNGFINGTSINSSGPLSAAGAITGASVVSNSFINGTSINSSGPLSAAGAITGASLTSNGLTSTSTFYASGSVNGAGSAIFNGVTSNSFIIGTSISSSGAISAAGNGTFANVTSNGFVQTTALNSSGQIIGASVISNGVVSGTSISTNGGITGGTITGALLVSNAGISAATTISAPGQITGGSFVSNSTVTGNVLTANSAVSTLALTASGNVRFTSANTTTSSTTGALVVTGGIATGNNLFVSGATWTGNISVTNTTASTNAFNGALVVAGGVGIAGDAHVGGVLDAQSLNATAVGNVTPSTGQFTTLITQNTATVSALVSNSFINGTSINSSGPLSAAGAINGASVTSNGFINGTSINSSGPISAAGAGTFANVTSNSWVQTTALNSTGQIVGANIYSNAAVVGATVQGSTSMLTGTFVANTSVATGTLTASGAATVNSLVSNTTVRGNAFIMNGNVSSTATTGTLVLDSFAAASFRTAHYLVQVTDNTNNRYHSTQILLIHDGTTVYQAEYNLIYSNSVLGTFDSFIVAGTVQLQFTASAATNKTVKVLRTAVDA